MFVDFLRENTAENVLSKRILDLGAFDIGHPVFV